MSASCRWSWCACQRGRSHLVGRCCRCRRPATSPGGQLPAPPSASSPLCSVDVFSGRSADEHTTQFYCWLLTSPSNTAHRVPTDIKTLVFQDLKDQIPGFSRSQKTSFQGLSIHKHGWLHEVKKWFFFLPESKLSRTYAFFQDFPGLEICTNPELIK